MSSYLGNPGWIVAQPKPEHVSAMSWLNDSGAGRFYLVKVEAVKIGNSPPAPLLTLIVEPSDEVPSEPTQERHIIRMKFWTQLLEQAKEKIKLHANISPNRFSWVGTSAGKRGLNFNYVIRRENAYVELYIDRGKEAEKENKAIFDKLAASKAMIEKSFGNKLEWERLETKRACRIKKRINVGGYRDPEEKWPVIHNARIDAMMRLEKSLRPHITKLRL